MSSADRVIIIGSTEKHYTASKTFQALLSEKPVFAIMHSESSTSEIMKESNADEFLVKYNDSLNTKDFENQIENSLTHFLQDNIKWKPNLKELDKYSAKKSAQALTEKLVEIKEIFNY